jgi:2'-5' RNA ligase
MPFAIELYFDASNEARLRALWDALVACGARLERHNASRPHLSLAVCEELDIEKAEALVTELATTQRQFPLVFPAFGIFPGTKPVLFLAPKVTPELLHMQQRFLSRFHEAAHGIWEHYMAERWNPHCTLATRIPRARLSSALAECRTFELPLHCTVMEVGIAALRPVEVRFVAPFRPHAV